MPVKLSAVMSVNDHRLRLKKLYEILCPPKLEILFTIEVSPQKRFRHPADFKRISFAIGDRQIPPRSHFNLAYSFSAMNRRWTFQISIKGSASLSAIGRMSLISNEPKTGDLSFSFV